MCGIAGILKIGSTAAIDDELMPRMVAMLNHRGPDESGVYLDDRIQLGHARLSIIGLDDGTQPICNEDRSLWIVYNGEAFNYLELKKELINKGHRFQTSTDTEVLLHLYEEYGPQCLEKINGQFALAIWDVNRKELFLARDRVGIRPLYYCHAGGKLLFASEIKALFLSPEVARELEPAALAQIFTLWTTVTPGTVFKGVSELAPGHFMIVKQGGDSCQQAYWSIPSYAAEEQWTGSLGEAKEALRAMLKDAVRLRLRADVPVGAYLSGGLDSSILTALISGHFNNRLRTFSLSFDENPFDESAYQRQLVRYLGTDHQQVSVSNAQIRDHFAQTVWHCEKPLLRTAPVPMFLLAKLVRDNNFKVVLTGEGADEVFGGYNIFKEAKIRHFWGRQPESLWRPLLVQKLYPYIFKDQARAKLFLQQFFAVKSEDLSDPLFSHRVRWATSGKNTSFLSAEVQQSLAGYNPVEVLRARLPEDFASRDNFSKAQFLEMEIFLSNYLLSSQGDRVGMGNSIELRHPFLDCRVIDFAARLPAKWKMRGLNEKYILKEAFAGMVPESINQRPKQPYRAPIREAFFSGGGASYVDDLLSENQLKKTGYFDPKKVGYLLAKFRKEGTSVANETQSMALVGILSTQLLHEQYLENFPTVKVLPIKPCKIVRK